MNGSKQTATQVIGVDIAKRVFQLHWIDVETGEIMSVQLKREKLLEHFANRAGCLIGMEACGGAQHWARKLIELGHAVKLLPAKMVKPFVGRNKSDAADARAIWTAVQQPAVKAVAVKSEAQQAVLALHRMRSQLVKFRTAQINGLRGLLAEYGEVMPQGRAGITKGIATALAQLVDRLPAVLLDTLREQWARVGQLDEQVAEIERRLRAWHKEDKASRRIAEIPGVGLLTATAAVAAMGDPKSFKSPGVCRLAGLGAQAHWHGRAHPHARHSKRGDTYLRTLLIWRAQRDAWVTNLTQRRPANVAVVALVRTIWALLAHEPFQKGYVSQRALTSISTNV